LPNRAKRPCANCGRATAKRLCPKCHEVKPQHKRIYDWTWQKAAKAYLDEHPLCVHCLAEEKTTVARVVDHVIPHRGDEGLFWDQGNWQALCIPHHNKKSAIERASLIS
jgi:5-methylcytosine-specific restriction protein A